MKKQLYFVCIGIAAITAMMVMAGCDSLLTESGDDTVTGRNVDVFTGEETGYNYPRSEPEPIFDGTFCIIPTPTPLVAMNVKLVNNTKSTVTVSLLDFYDAPYVGLTLSGNVPLDLLASQKKAHTADGKSTSAFQFDWSPKSRLINIPASLIFNSVPESLSGENVVKNFQPYMMSFALVITIDGVDHYLAGWPRSQIIPSVILDAYVHDYDSVIGSFDRSKIVQYGIGYGDNKEAFLLEGGYAYLPFVISYVENGQTVEKNFGLDRNLHLIRGEAVITIDAPDKINYRTVSLSPSERPPYEDPYKE